MPSALPYEEPSLIHLLVSSSFLYLLNAVRVTADFFLHGGVVAEIALGIIYGSPLTGLLPTHWEETFTVLGYTGLILVVFQGGLSSNLPMLLSNLPLSTACALVGIGLPIALSFALLNAGFGYRPLEAFAAGAALSSTSLGTTLAALSAVTKDSPASSKGHVMSTPETTSTASLPVPATRASFSQHPAVPSTEASATSIPNNLQQSRIGTVLISAAIIDDVVGLVIAAVIPALASVGSSSPSNSERGLAWTVIRPLLSSLLIAAIAPIVARFFLRPLFWYRAIGERWCAPARLDKFWGTRAFAKVGTGWGADKHADAVKLLMMIGALSAMAAISYYTGTSILYGAYTAGLVLTYISNPPPSSHPSSNNHETLGRENSQQKQRLEDLSFEAAFARTVGPVQEHVFLPLFFASIGFAIPFLELWRPLIIWRGIVYSILMCLAKLAVGLPILLHAPLVNYTFVLLSSIKRCIGLVLGQFNALLSASHKRTRTPALPANIPPCTSSGAHTRTSEKRNAHFSKTPVANHADTTGARASPSAPTSFPAAIFMGVAMVARGEIGLLIAQLARGGSNGEPGLLGTEPFLLCIWAILLCTLVGPVSLGFVVRRWGARVNAGVWA